MFAAFLLFATLSPSAAQETAPETAQEASQENQANAPEKVESVETLDEAIAKIREGESTSAPPQQRPIAPKKLDGRTRARAMAALAGLVILGLGMLSFAWLGARMTRRYMKGGEKKQKRPVDPIFTDDWASKPLSSEERLKLDADQW